MVQLRPVCRALLYYYTQFHCVRPCKATTFSMNINDTQPSTDAPKTGRQHSLFEGVCIPDCRWVGPGQV